MYRFVSLVDNAIIFYDFIVFWLWLSAGDNRITTIAMVSGLSVRPVLCKWRTRTTSCKEMSLPLLCRCILNRPVSKTKLLEYIGCINIRAYTLHVTLLRVCFDIFRSFLRVRIAARPGALSYALVNRQSAVRECTSQ